MKQWVLAACLLISFSVHADFLDWNKLKNLGQSAHEANVANFRSGYFEGYITGVTDTLNGIAVCLPPTVTAGQVTAIVLKYADANPEAWNSPADILVSKALQPVYPCHRKPTSHKPASNLRTF